MRAPFAPRFRALRPCILIGISLVGVNLLTGCGDASDRGADSRPIGSGAVTDSALIDVLADMHLTGAEQYLSLRSDSSRTAPEDSSDQLIGRLQTGSPVDSLLAVHGISRAGYNSAIDWYVDHPDEFVNLYNRVLDRLNQVQ